MEFNSVHMKRKIFLSLLPLDGKSSLRSFALLIVFAGWLNGFSAQAQVQIVTDIDRISTSQLITANEFNPTPVSVIRTAGAIGGWRTLALTGVGNFSNGDEAALGASASTGRFSLSTSETITTFRISWNGTDGTAGLGGFQFGNGQSLDLATSFLRFTVRSADILGTPFQWKFIDTQNRTAFFNGGFPFHTSLQPSTVYNMYLNQFTNGGTIDWNAINTIEFSGGGQDAGFDMGIQGPITFTANVPEPGGASLVILGLAAVLGRSRRCRK